VLVFQSKFDLMMLPDCERRSGRWGDFQAKIEGWGRKNPVELGSGHANYLDILLKREKYTAI